MRYPQSILYRPDIDGLRAIAVLAVVIFHAFPKTITGGFVGVDVFFVISGYLISSIIFSQLATGEFSFKRFYIHRIRRIFPALILVLVACTFFAWFVLFSDEYQQLAKHVLGGAGFISNYLSLDETGYFDTASEKKPLLHLWSLSIEEQFYLLWPPMLLVLWKYFRFRLAIIIFLTGISFALNVLNVGANETWTFYSPQTRFWELSAGAVLAYLSVFRVPRPVALSGTAVAEAASVAGLALIVLALFLITQADAFPGLWALIPVCGTCMTIAAGPQTWLNRRLLSNRLMIAIGSISYPLYLWHWPILSFENYFGDDAVHGDLARAVAVACSFGLAWLTFVLVEKPIRFGPSGGLKAIACLSTMTLIAASGALIYLQNGFPFRISEFEKIVSTDGAWQHPGRMTSFLADGHYFWSENSDRPEKVMFIGDSNMEQYYPRMDELILRSPSTTRSIVYAAIGGCLPIPGISAFSDIYAYCDGYPEAAIKYALDHKEITRVVMTAMWDYYLLGTFKRYVIHDGQHLEIDPTSPGYRLALQNLGAYIKTLVDDHRQVIVVMNIPFGTEFDPKYIVQRSLLDFPYVFRLTHDRFNLQAFRVQYETFSRDLLRVIEDNGAQAIDPTDYLCQKGTCPSLTPDGSPMYKDYFHLNSSYVRSSVTFLDTVMQLH